LNKNNIKYKNKFTHFFFLRRRWGKFKSLKRSYYSFLILVFFYLISIILPVLIGNSAIIVRYNNKYYFPIFKYIDASEFNQIDFGKNNTGKKLQGEANYRWLRKQFSEEGKDNFVLMPLYPYAPNENLLEEIEGAPPHPPGKEHIFGTDDRGRDVFARLAYGFNISLSFSILVTLFTFIVGIIFGAILGFYGGKIDMIGLRIIEIWSTLPVIYILIILSSVLRPNFFWLTLMLIIFGWVGISFYIRGEFYREKTKDYVLAAITTGVPNFKIIIKHILPNAMTPVISFAPFAIVGYISTLTALDFLGFGLPPPTPSWGELIGQGMKSPEHWWLVVTPLVTQFITLLMIVFIGEGAREALDPKPYSVYK
jgi:microcin C transport system permease protein